jgi:hypothetical protein
MRRSSVALAAVASLTLFDIAMATAANAFSDPPIVGENGQKVPNNCFPKAEARATSNAGIHADIRILTKHEAETLRSYREFGCADNPTSTVYV